LYAAYSADGLTAITSLIGASTPDDLVSWREAFGSEHPVLLDADETVWSLYGLRHKPHYVVIDRDFTIQYVNDDLGAGTAAEAVAISYL